MLVIWFPFVWLSEVKPEGSETTNRGPKLNSRGLWHFQMKAAENFPVLQLTLRRRSPRPTRTFVAIKKKRIYVNHFKHIFQVLGFPFPFGWKSRPKAAFPTALDLCDIHPLIPSPAFSAWYRGTCVRVIVGTQGDVSQDGRNLLCPQPKRRCDGDIGGWKRFPGNCVQCLFNLFYLIITQTLQ